MHIIRYEQNVVFVSKGKTEIAAMTIYSSRPLETAFLLPRLSIVIKPQFRNSMSIHVFVTSGFTHS